MTKTVEKNGEGIEGTKSDDENCGPKFVEGN